MRTSINPSRSNNNLVTLDSGVNVSHKDQTELEASTTEHDEEGIGYNAHVSKEERPLQHTTHFTSVEVIVERIYENKETCHTSVDVRGPPPAVIFSCELEIQESNSDERSNNHQQNEGQEEDSKQSIDLVTPHRSKDVVKFDVNSREGKETGNEDLKEATPIPRDFSGDFSRNLCRSGRCIKVTASVVLRHHCTENSEWEGNENVKRNHSQQSRDGERTRRSVSPGNRVQNKEGGGNWCGE